MNATNFFCAIRGPVMLITVGSLFALDHMGMFSFGRTWPLLIIMFGVMKLLERVVATPQPPYPPPPYTGTTGGAQPGGAQQ